MTPSDAAPADPEAALINPYCGKASNRIGPVAFLVSNDEDRRAVCEALDLPGKGGRALLMSRLVAGAAPGGPSVCGPFIGAPYATILLENLIVRGARTIVFFGWCGAIQPGIRIGDLVLPTAALIDEGTSTHYGAVAPLAAADDTASRVLHRRLQSTGMTTHKGPVWTTDAVFRETHRAVDAHRQGGLLGVEMELSAVFSVGAFRKVAVCAVLVVSDTLTGSRWQPGFKNERFVASRRRVCRALAEYYHSSPGPT